MRATTIGFSYILLYTMRLQETVQIESSVFLLTTRVIIKMIAILRYGSLKASVNIFANTALALPWHFYFLTIDLQYRNKWKLVRVVSEAALHSIR